METVGDRVKTLKDKLGFATMKEFAEALGAKHSSGLGMLTRNNNVNPSYEFLANLLNTFPQVNPEWLMSGRGLVLRDNLFESTHLGKRVLMICELEGITKEEFAEKIGRSTAYINSLLSTKPIKIANDLVCAISDAFPNIRPTWLVYGNEPMLTRESKGVRVEVGDQMVEVVISIVPKG